MTEYEWQVQGYFTAEHGWEGVDAHESKADAEDALATYRENDTSYPYRVKRVLVTLD